MENIRRWIHDRFGSNSLDWLDRSYIADWTVVGILYALGWLASGIPPFERDFSRKDSLISHPHKKSQIGGTVNQVITLWVPVVLIVVAGSIKRSALEIHHGVIAMASGWGLAHLITEFLKNTVGRLRPDFLARCKWDKALKACTGKADKILDGRRSFPSGHSSGAFAGMLFLSLWIAGQTGAWCFHRPSSGRVLRATRLGRFILSLCPVFLAIYIAVTRVEDYRHHKEDVIVGSLIGIFSALTCYLIFWPSPFSMHESTTSLGPRILYTEDGEPRTFNGYNRARGDDLELERLEEEIGRA